VSIDNDDEIPEYDETDNLRLEEWKCDEDPPAILKGPSVVRGQTSIVITWETDEESSSVVKIDDKRPVSSRTVSNQTLTRRHRVAVDGLTPSHGYAFYVESADRSGNVVTGSVLNFFTLDEEDHKDPSVRIVDETTDGRLKEIRVDAADDHGVRKVAFYLD